MILHRMSATFGQLDNARLELEPGLNILAAPNEGGKSTWAAFLLTMLYGVNTAERTSKANQLPAKTRYKPWSGRPMEGSLELTWQGRRVTLERTCAARSPMGQLRAFDTGTGQLIDLPESACGQTLLGVERSVYERSGFIRQQGLALSPDHALEARLQALVTTGDEDAAGYTQVKKRLEALRNRRRHNHTGLLPQAEQALAETEDRLAALRRLGRENMDLQARLEQLEAREAQLLRLCAALKAQEDARKRAQLAQYRAEWEKKAAALAEKEATVRGIPEIPDLQALQQKWDQLQSAVTALAPAWDQAAPPAPPGRPAVFDGMTPDQVRDAAEADCRRLEALGRPPLLAPKAVWLWAALAAALLAGGGAALCLRAPVWAAAVCFGAGTLAAAWAVLRLVRNRRARENAASLLQRYGASDAAAIRRAAADCREALLLHEKETEQAAARRAVLEEQRQAFATQQAALVAAVRSFQPDAEDPGKAIQRAVNLWKFHDAAQRDTDAAREKYEAAAAAVGELPEAVPAGPEVAGDPAAARRELEDVRRELAQVRSRLDQARGRMEASGDPASLAAQREQLTADIARLEREHAALTLALAALTQANDVLQTRFSPRINQLAARYMARLTGARYDRVLLEQSMQITAREAGGAVSRPLQALSTGTADQLYLAVRLAITELALPKDAPLVLDDALLSFDDQRLAAALELLEELAQERQILLFTCQSREQAWRDARK
ncbi:MAG: AAA family ATPase [Oscillospiraceae bacterium]|nr:AAA family ATPase [Oscillospiraceae bacterium]